MTQKRFWSIVLFLGVFFLLLRLPGLFHIYHQDEYKWAMIIDPTYGLQGTIPHPPLGEFLYQMTGAVLGYDWLRVLPIFISLANLLLGIILVRRWYGSRVALIFGGLFTILSSSLLASLQVDIDGALLPFWTLLAFLGVSDYRDLRRRRRGLILLGIALLGGFLTKISFFLVPLALFIEWFFQKQFKGQKKIMLGALGLGLFFLLLWISPALDFIRFVRYAKSFGVLNFLSRDYFELLLLTLKSLILLGPWILLAFAAAIRTPKRHRLLLVFVGLQILFYYVLFDFTHRTIERYLLVFVFPVAALAADYLGSLSISFREFTRRGWMILLVCLALFIGIVLIPKSTLPLHPKEQFVHQILSGRLNFLIPITGGSGPIGFFVPADLTLFAFGLVLVCLFWMKGKTASRRWLVIPLVTFTLLFSLFTSSEYLFGTLYGNASSLAKQALVFVNNTQAISQVITYNDIGGWELHESNKYFKRFYLNPEFTATNEKKFSTYQGYYLVVDMPPISVDQKVAKYLATCKEIYHQSDKMLHARVYDCREETYSAKE